MKTKHLLLLGLVIAFSSCSTAYRSGQTPDDVYYSPAPPQDTYVRTDNQEEKDSYSYNNSYNSEDLEIRRGIRDSRYRDNNVIVSLGYGGYSPYSYDPYGYNPYAYNGYSHYGGYNSLYYNPYDAYSSNFYVSPYYNYYYSPQVYIYPTTGASRTIAPRRYNLGAYNNSTNNTRMPNSGYRPVVTSSAPVRTFTPRPANNGSGVGNLMRRVFTPDNSSSNNRSFRNDNSNYSNTNSSPVRSTQTTSGSSSSSSGSSSSAPVRTFRK